MSPVRMDRAGLIQLPAFMSSDQLHIEDETNLDAATSNAVLESNEMLTE